MTTLAADSALRLAATLGLPESSITAAARRLDIAPAAVLDGRVYFSAPDAERIARDLRPELNPTTDPK